MLKSNAFVFSEAGITTDKRKIDARQLQSLPI